MIVLDSLTGTEDREVTDRWLDLLDEHGIEDEDARIIYAVRRSLLHGYGLPKPELVDGRRAVMIAVPDRYAVDTEEPGVAYFNVPVFCSRLVERVAFQAYNRWDASLVIDTNHPLGPGSGY